MNDKQLRSFLLTAQEGSMTRAAERAFLSVPSLKKQIDQLEAELHVTLFARSNRGVELTREGEMALEFARSTLGEWQSLQRRLAPQEDCLRVGYNSNHMRDFIYFRALRAFKAQYPEVKVLLEEAPSFDTSAYDLFLGYCDEEDERIGRSLLGHMPLHCIVSRASALADKPALQVQDLAGMDLLIPPEHITGKIRPDLVTALRTAGCGSLRENRKDGSAYTINSYVSEGISVIVGRERETPEAVRQVPLSGFSYDYHIFYARRSIGRQMVQDYIHLLQEGYACVLREFAQQAQRE